MKLLRFLLLVCTFSVVAACDGEASRRAQTLQTENTTLRKEMEGVKRELDELKFGPSRLLAQIDPAAGKGDWLAVKKLAEDLITRHPTSTEAAQAKQLLVNAEAALVKAAKDAEDVVAKLVEAERQQKLQEEERIAPALAKMEKDIDTIENVTTYTNRSSSEGARGSSNFILYILTKPSYATTLKFSVRYYSSDWLFIHSFLVVADGQRFDYSSTEFQRDNGSGQIWETYQKVVSSEDIKMVKAVIASKSAVIRFYGSKHTRDRTFTAVEKAALQNVLDAYKALGGKELDRT